ncbi:hypothetical protein JRO89_XS01G0118600 [Xanthoceras sorbifolium]|uniref:Pre-nudix hydrolase domain-containing protein n=1 Tax=Xanthoceras sorbifolium TaxID=99658 RepID=A0ABQ8IIS7_9ROSI|nr:hypothetical protein JRO89_XS01G0118600 [Xanthoceras sorbifolium]
MRRFFGPVNKNRVSLLLFADKSSSAYSLGDPLIPERTVSLFSKGQPPRNRIPFLMKNMSTSTSSWSVEKEMNEVERIELLSSIEDAHGGVTVDVKESMDSKMFSLMLKTSLFYWTQQGKRGVWIKLPIEFANLVEPAVKEGFRYHHAEPDYLMLVKWISETTDTLPENASHRDAIA